MERARQTNADFYGFLAEQLDGTEDIKALGAASYVLNYFYPHGRRILAYNLKSIIGFAIGTREHPIFTSQ